ncbi:MAG: nuclear transport factor 2 family protein [Pseudomonadales bacterium]|nr:nuclear transport factor 2 family protein [Pseudomonadales bacterium]MBO6594597.1 nuclear transport factor 2 family protein [Pseudomonadales bacterium]MBO6821842.1 nuclear transport factor 2 family protein [Pseudomonadales bacterium]
MPEELEARIQRLEDLEAIRRLKATYCDICDDDHNAERIITIFTEDGTWEGEGIGTAKGHEAIRKLFDQFSDAIKFSQHMVHNPIIDVDGDEAIGRWYFHGMFTMRRNDKPMWQACRYHEVYRRTPDGWKIHHLKITEPKFAASYDKGWAL